MGMGEADLTTYGSRTLGFLGSYVRARGASCGNRSRGGRSGDVFGQHAIRGQEAGRCAVGAIEQRKSLARVLRPVVLHRSRQLVLARGGPHRELYVRARHRRHPRRPISAFDRACAKLFRQAHAWHADEPGDGDVERCLHNRKHVRL